MNTRQMHLFDEISVTEDDIERWMSEIHHISLLRRKYYVKYWNVADKIKRAKLRGEF